jgi:hypothetical protein
MGNGTKIGRPKVTNQDTLSGVHGGSTVVYSALGRLTNQGTEQGEEELDVLSPGNTSSPGSIRDGAPQAPRGSVPQVKRLSI